jgi:PAS domain-containing protein
VRDEAGALVGFIKVMRDESERRRLQRERDRFFSLSMDMLCIVHLDGYFLRTNPAFERVLGYSSEELRNQRVFDLLHPADRDAAIEASAVQREWEPEPTPDPCALDGVTVLLVEDEPDTRDLLTTILQECGARVIRGF